MAGDVSQLDSLCWVLLQQILNRQCGGSTGTNLYAAFQIISELSKKEEHATVVSMICDGGERYLDSYHNDAWLSKKGFQIEPYVTQLRHFYDTGVWDEIAGASRSFG